MKIFKIAFTVFLMPVVIFGWSASTHKLLSAYACINSKLIKENLIWKLNLGMGAAHPLTVENETNTVSGWIYDGAEKEDKGNYPIWDRSARHFHNPLKVFGEAGLTRVLQHLQSSILWAQDSVEQDKFDEGDMSWQKVKEYYYNALISDTEEKRHLNFGLMFKGLGHQIHLVQDMSNPEHTRNDNHPFFTIESWAEEHNNDIIDGFCQTALFPNIDLETLVNDSSTGRTLSPIARLTDADVYTPENPVPSANTQQGLSEYSNANFFSDDTIFSIDFPYPSLINADISKIFTKINTEYKPDEKGVYLPKNNEGDPITHFLRLVYLKKYTTQSLLHLSYLDDLCYKDYASMLVPRAVGYSAALINYFFRGEIEITLPVSAPGSTAPQLDGIYSLCVDPAKGFENMSLMVKNITPDNEEMRNGQVSLILSYRLGNGSPFVPNPPIPDEERYYKVYSCPGVTAIPRDNPLRLDVAMSGNPLPVNAVDVTLTIVFKGDLGAEKTDAVAIGFKDISEPTPVDLFNNSDKVCFNNGYVNYDDPALWAAVDINPKNGKIDCLYNAEIDITRRQIWPIFLSFNGAAAYSENYYFQFENGTQILPGATPLRIYVLSDAYPSPINLSVFTHSESMDNDDDCSMYLNGVISFNPYTNKLEWIDSLKPEERHYEPIHSMMGYFRGFPVWNLGLFENSKVPASSVCSAPPSAAASSSSASLNNKSLGDPKIIAVTPIKKSE